MGNGYCMCKSPQIDHKGLTTISFLHPQTHDSNLNTSINKLSSLTPKLKACSQEIQLFTLDSTSFESSLLNEINMVRSNPSAYAQKLSQMLEYITESRNVFYFSYPHEEKLVLRTGKNIFFQTIDYLKTLSPIPELTWNNDLKININEQPKPLTEEIIGKILLKKRLEIKEKFNDCTFNFDCMANPVLSVVFQLTDEPFEQKRRNAILGSFYKNFAVSHTFDPIRRFVSILTFA